MEGDDELKLEEKEEGGTGTITQSGKVHYRLSESRTTEMFKT